MLLKLYDANGIAQPLIDVKNAHIVHKEDGCDHLIFRMSVQHPLYHTIAEESQIDYGDNEWLVKKIQDDQIECEINLDFLKTTVRHNYKYQNQLVGRVLADNLPAGWTIIGADDCVLHRGATYEHCTPYEVVYDCISKYDVRYVWNTKAKTLTIRVPSRIEPEGVYLSDQLNLKTLTFQGSSTGFITRLYPYGKDGLTVASVNAGKEYIDDNTYSSKVVCAYWVDERYEDPLTLLENAYKKLAEMAKPERSYECTVRDLEKESSRYGHLALRMHDKITLLVAERKLRVVYSIVEYTEYPDAPDDNKVTISCVPETIQNYTQALVKANIDHALTVAEKALDEADKAAEEAHDVRQRLEGVEETVDEVSERADDAFNRAESAMLEADTAEMHVQDVVRGLANPSDAYFCGDKSPTYGFQYEDAASVLESGIIYIPTEAHTEKYNEIEEFGIIDSKAPGTRGTEEVETTYDAGAPGDDRTDAQEIYSSTPSQRVQAYGADFYFYTGYAYIWQNGGWSVLMPVIVAEEEPQNVVDGNLWLCTATHSSDGVEYEKDTVYRWTSKEDSEGGLWIAKANKAVTYSYKALSTVRDTVVAITAELTEHSANIQLLTAWKTQASQAIADLELVTSDQSASITTLLTFMGDTERGAIKAIADLEGIANAHEAKLVSLIAWMGDSESGAIKAIADVTQTADANAAAIEGITTWIGDSTGGAVKAIADVTQTADANAAAILTLTTWKNGAAESIAQLEETTTAQGAQVTALTERVGETETNVAQVTALANANAANIVSLTQTTTQAAQAIASLEQTTTAQGAQIVSLVSHADETDTHIAEIIQQADEQGASIRAIVSNDEKAFALSGRKYVVGKKAPTYGYSYELACGIMETGTLYVPDGTHTEHYDGEWTGTVYSADAPGDNRTNPRLLEAPLTNRYGANTIDCETPMRRAQQGGSDILFELGWCYRWTGSGWAKDKTVSLYTEKTEGADDELWFCSQNITETDEETGFTRTLYAAGTLYCWIGGKWVSLADTCNNYAQMAASSIEIQYNTIAARVSTNEGNISALQLRVTEYEATVTLLAQWKTNVQDDVANIASIEAKADAAGAGLLLKADKTTSLSRADVFYALSTSATTAPTTGWSTEAPEWESGKFMWQKTVCTYASGATTESAPTCLTGAKGEDGTSVTILGSYDTVEDLRRAHPTGNEGDAYLVAGYLYVWNGTDWQNVGQIQGPAGLPGTGISSIKEQYYLSTSNTTQTGGSWVDACPAWTNGKYIWTRSYIVWSNGTQTTTTPQLANALNSFGASIAVNTHDITLKVNAGDIVSTINQSAEAVKIAASKINIAGVISAINDDSTTTINGGKITTGTITADQIDATNLHVSSANIDGAITATSLVIKNAQNLELLNAAGSAVNIGAFTIGRDYSKSFLYSGKTGIDKPAENGVYLGTNGIAVGGASDGAGGYYNIVLNGATGKLTANNVDITGKITATSGTIENLHITDKIYLGTGTTYYLNANGSGDYYVKLKNFTVNDTNAYFSGSLSAPSGNIGGFTIASSKLYKNQTTYDGSAAGDTAGVYLGTNGIGLGAGKFYVTSAGALTATQATVTGTIYANAGTLESLTITGKLFFGGNSQYYIDANHDNQSWYIYLKNFRVDETNAIFSGNLSAPTGTIGGFTIASGKLYKTKTTYSDSNSGVYLGTDGIGLGAGTFYVTSAGALHSTSGDIAGFTIASNAIRYGKTSYSETTNDGVYVGTSGIGLGKGAFYVTSAGKLHCTNIEATGGTIGGLTISGRLTFGGNSSYYIDPNRNDSAYYINLPGLRVDDASGAVFSGKLSAPTGTIGGWTIGTPTGGSSAIYKANSSYCVGMQSGMTATNLAFFVKAGSDMTGSDLFYVRNNGQMYAQNATISGTFTNKTAGYGLDIVGSKITFYNGNSSIGYLQAGTGYIPWSHQTGTVSGIAVSCLLCADKGIRVGNGGLQMSTGNGVYIDGKLALTMGQIKVQTNSLKTRYLLFYNGILVGISADKYSGYYDYSESTYSGD